MRMRIGAIMKKILMTTVGLVALGLAPAVAADLAARTYTKAPAAVSPLYNWTGFYIGAMGGYGKEDTSDFALSGGFGGGTAGYNWQTGQFVFGIEADVAGADERASATALGVTISDTKTRTGWTAGAGVEWMFLPHWSVKGEYLYRSFSSETIFSGVIPGGLATG